MNFCRRCGAKLSQKSEGMFVCENSHTLFVNAAPAASVFFVRDDQVLLSVRGVEPFKGMLDSPGGFVEESESLEDALVREIKEELGITPDNYGDLKFLCSCTTQYPYDNEERTVLGTFFWANLNSDAQPVAADDVSDVKFIPLDDIDLSQIGNGDVKVAIQKLQELFAE